MTVCSKPGCTRTGAAVLGYDYAERLALLEDPPHTGQVSPHVYVLCVPCAERLRPPQGWVLEDARAEPPLFVAGDRPEHSTAGSDDDIEPVTTRKQLFFGYSA
ncbi:MAG: hypothetical protein QOG04_1062 [Actinomycetota bacterium]|jgi:hypothetical protein|nr:hypothetical protein [Actinomycetota bacterium]